jgi:hypothetical protein
MSHNIVNPIYYPDDMKPSKAGNEMRRYLKDFKNSNTYTLLEDKLRVSIQLLEKNGYKSGDKS